MGRTREQEDREFDAAVRRAELQRLAADERNPTVGRSQLEANRETIARLSPADRAEFDRLTRGRMATPSVEGVARDRRAEQERLALNPQLAPAPSPLDFLGGLMSAGAGVARMSTGALGSVFPMSRDYWSWLDPSDYTALPFQPSVSASGEVRPGRWAPVGVVGDVLGSLGTVRDIARDEMARPALGAALWGLSQAEQAISGQHGRALFDPEAGSQTPLTSPTRAGFARWLEENTPDSAPAKMAVGIVEDPSSYLGSGIARGAMRAMEAAGAGAAAKALLPAAIIDEAYTSATHALLGGVRSGTTGAFGKVMDAAKRTPILGAPFRPDPKKLGAIEEADRALGALRMVRGLNEQVRHLRRAIADSYGQTTPRISVPRNTSGETLSKNIAAQMQDMGHGLVAVPPQMLPAATRIVGEFLTEKGISEARVASKVAAFESDAMERMAASGADKDVIWKEILAMRSESWRNLWREVAVRAHSANAILKEMATLPFGDAGSPSHIPVPPHVADRLAGAARSTAESMAGAARRAQNVDHMARALEDISRHLSTPGALTPYMTAAMKAAEATDPGKLRGVLRGILADFSGGALADTAERKIIQDTVRVFSIKAKHGLDPFSLLREAGGDMNRPFRLQVSDIAFREARDSAQLAVAELQQAAEASGVDPRILSLGDEYLARFHRELGWIGDEVAGRGWESALPKEMRDALRSWNIQIEAATASLESERNAIIRQLWRPIEDGLLRAGKSDEEIAALLERSSSSRSEMLHLFDTWADQSLSGVRQDALRKMARHRGDILNDRIFEVLVDEDVARRIGTAMGVKGPNALLEPVRIALSAWSNMALLSLRYPAGNLAFGLWLSHHAGLPMAEIMTNLGANLKRVGRHLREYGLEEVAIDPRPPAASMPGMRALGMVADDPAGGVTVVRQSPEMMATKSIDWLTNFSGAAKPSTSLTALGRIGSAPLGIIGAAGGGVAGWFGDQDLTTQERAQRAAIGAASGGAVGASLPKAAYALYLLTSAIEMALRDTAFYHGVMEAAPAAWKAARDDIANLLEPGSLRVRAQQGLTRTELPRRGDAEGALREIDRRIAEFERGNHDVGMAPHQIEEVLTRYGWRYDVANQAGAMVRRAQAAADAAGTGLSNRINIDYRKVTRAEDFLRSSGIMPFVVWQARMYPVIASLMVQNPRYVVAIDMLNNISREEQEEAGIPVRFTQMVNAGSLGTFLADKVLDRKGNMYINPITVIMPFADAFGAPRSSGGSAPLDPAMSAMATIGLSPSPLVTIPAEATGLISDRAGSIFRPSGYAEMASYAMGAAAGDPKSLSPEWLLQTGITAARGAITGQREASISGDPYKDYLIRQRINEMSIERTGRPPVGQWAAARYDGTSPIWRSAQVQVERQMAGQTAIGSTVPMRTRFASQTEGSVWQAQARAGVSQAALDRLRSAMASDPRIRALPPEMQELAYRQAVNRLRIGAQSAQPGTAAFLGSGASPGATLAQQKRIDALMSQTGR